MKLFCKAMLILKDITMLILLILILINVYNL